MVIKMRKIETVHLSKDAFEEFGSYYDFLNPTGHNLGDFYHDHILYPVSGKEPIGFSALLAHRKEEMIVTAAEYHNTTAEILLPMDGDIIVHVAPPSNKPIPEQTRAFLVPKGTLVRLNTGVWHLAPFARGQEVVHVMVALPERIYKNDCVIVDYKEEDYIQIVQ